MADLIDLIGILIALRPPGCIRIMKYHKGLDRRYGQMIDTLDEVDDEDENETLIIACPPVMMMETNVNSQTLSLIAPTKILQINVFLNQS